MGGSGNIAPAQEGALREQQRMPRVRADDYEDKTRAIMDALRASPPAEKPVPEADPDDGPGFGEP